MQSSSAVAHPILTGLLIYRLTGESADRRIEYLLLQTSVQSTSSTASSSTSISTTPNSKRHWTPISGTVIVLVKNYTIQLIEHLGTIMCNFD